MSTPEDPGLIAWLLDHAWPAFLGLIGVVWHQSQSTIKANKKEADQALKAHKEEDQRQFARLEVEQETQRNHIGKLFDKLEEHSHRSEDRHVEVLKALHEGLNSKADR